jgi:predicted amidohydrolase
MKKISIFGFLSAVSLGLASAGTANLPSYRAATVEFVPQLIADSATRVVSRAEALALTVANAKAMTAYISAAAAQGADIVVFPEDGLYGAAFAGREGLAPFLETLPSAYGTNLCAGDDSPISILACAAASSAITVVADVGEAVPCGNNIDDDVDNLLADAAAPCPADGQFQYNTQVVIDAAGAFVAKYHKTHLFPEDTCCFDAGTSGVVTFPLYRGPPSKSVLLRLNVALFICFDIFFHAPVVSAVRDHGVTDFVFSTYFENNGTDPFRISALGILQGVSRALNINIIASNVGTGALDSGSGIFVRGTSPSLFYNPTHVDASHMVVADIPAESAASDVAVVRAQQQKKGAAPPAAAAPAAAAPPFVVVHVVEGQSGSASLKTSDGHVACSIDYHATSVQVNPRTGAREATFALLAASPQHHPFLGGALRAAACAFVPCASGGDPCGQGNGNDSPFEMVAPATFSNAALTASFHNTGFGIIIPVFGNGYPGAGLVPFHLKTGFGMNVQSANATLGGAFQARWLSVSTMVLWQTFE